MKLGKAEDIFNAEIEVLLEAENILNFNEGQDNFLLPHYKNLADGYRKLLKQSIKLVSIGDTQEEYLCRIQNDLKNVLDTIGQGIFIADEDLVVDSCYSTECLHIFEQNIENKRFTDIIRLYNSTDKVEIIEQILNKALFTENEFRAKVLMQLLPDEISYKSKFLNVKYKLFRNEWNNTFKNQFMIILTDITEKKRLERQIEEERSLLGTVVRIITDRNTFMQCINDFSYFTSKGLEDILNGNELNRDVLLNMFRSVHTFKGDFSIFDMQEIVARLHEIEHSLSVLIDNYDRMSTEEIKGIIKGYDMKTPLNHTLEKVKGIIGHGYFEKEGLTISKDRVIKLEAKIKGMGKEIVDALLKDVSSLKHIELKTLLNAYPEYVQRLAHRQGKFVEQFEIQSPQSILIDEAVFNSFTRTLTNVFRNAVCHGIEDPVERLISNKPEYGKIECFLQASDTSIEIIISDDGRGIDLKELRRIAVEEGFYKDKDVRLLDDKELTNMILSDRVTTAKGIDELAGRGEGLAAVAEALKQLGGTVHIDSFVGRGTVFRFVLPRMQ